MKLTGETKYKKRNQLLENSNRNQLERIEHLENDNQLLNNQIGRLIHQIDS